MYLSEESTVAAIPQTQTNLPNDQGDPSHTAKRADCVEQVVGGDKVCQPTH